MALRLTELHHCPSCKSKRPAPLYPLPQFQVYECETCKLRYIDPSLDAQSMMDIYQSSELLREINPALENYYEYETLNPNTLTYRDYDRALKEASALSPGKALLEVGCGTGSFLEFAKERGWNPTGVDSGSENIEKLKSKGLQGACCGFLDYQPTQKFDCIVLWDLIEHPQDPVSFVKKSFELLNPGGLLLLATPHYPNLLTVLSDLFYSMSGGKVKGPLERLYMLEHTTYFGDKTLTYLVEKHGFRVAKKWKTETDLARYKFSPLLRVALHASFLLARFLGLQNRLILIAQKPS